MVRLWPKRDVALRHASQRRVGRKEAPVKGIRVNAVAPGQIATQFHERFGTPEGRAQTVRTIPLGREGKAEDVASVVVFLASSAADFVAGEVMAVNGGMLFH